MTITINKLLNFSIITLFSLSLFFYNDFNYNNTLAGTMGYENAGGKIDQAVQCTCLEDPCFPQTAFHSGEPRGGNYIDSMTCTYRHYDRSPITVGSVGAWHLSKTTETKQCQDQDEEECIPNMTISEGRLLLFGGTSR